MQRLQWKKDSGKKIRDGGKNHTLKKQIKYIYI